MSENSGEASVLSLQLQSGERFDDVPLVDPALSLANFLDSALKRLEVGCTSRARTYIELAARRCWPIGYR